MYEQFIAKPYTCTSLELYSVSRVLLGIEVIMKQFGQFIIMSTLHQVMLVNGIELNFTDLN